MNCLKKPFVIYDMNMYIIVARHIIW